MKVKELIAELQKRDLEDEIHIFVDDEIGCGSGEHRNYYSNNIKIGIHETYYMDEDSIKNEEELLEYVFDSYDLSTTDSIEKVDIAMKEEMKKQIKLEGLWVYIQP